MVKEPKKDWESSLSYQNLATQHPSQAIFPFLAWKSVVLTPLRLFFIVLILIVGQSLTALRITYSYHTAHTCSLFAYRLGKLSVLFSTPGGYSPVVLVERFKRGLKSARNPLSARASLARVMFYPEHVSRAR